MSQQPSTPVPNFDDHWDVQRLKPEDLKEEVVAIHLVAYPNKSNKHVKEDLTPTNHWCVFLEIRNNKSVKVNMKFGYGADRTQGRMELSSRDYARTQNTIKTLSFGPSLHTTVQKIVGLIQQNGLQKYEFTPICEGCRYWNKIFFRDLENAGYTKPGSAEEAVSVLIYYWAFPQGQEWRDIDEGKFISE